jgi:hypothetical protein
MGWDLKYAHRVEVEIVSENSKYMDHVLIIRLFILNVRCDALGALLSVQLRTVCLLSSPIMSTLSLSRGSEHSAKCRYLNLGSGSLFVFLRVAAEKWPHDHFLCRFARSPWSKIMHLAETRLISLRLVCTSSSSPRLQVEIKEAEVPPILSFCSKQRFALLKGNKKFARAPPQLNELTKKIVALVRWPFYLLFSINPFIPLDASSEKSWNFPMVDGKRI